jgi:hypothetical protein
MTIDMISEAAFQAIDARLGEHLGEVPRRFFDFHFYQSVELTDRYGLEWAL